jgi:hypothetical protein
MARTRAVRLRVSVTHCDGKYFADVFEMGANKAMPGAPVVGKLDVIYVAELEVKETSPEVTAHNGTIVK